VCVLSSAVNDFSDGGLKKVALFHLSRGVSGVLGRFPSKLFKAGPSDEPAGVMRQFSAWAPSGAFRSEDGATDYWEALGRVTLPVLVGVGEADVFHASPRRAEKLASHLGSADKTFLVCGRSHGFASDFGHVDLVRGERARAEVLPRVHEWMRARAPKA
jgi:predicted alpha/beta hydrolase